MSHLSRFQAVLLTFSLVFGVDGTFKSLAPDRAADMSLFNTIEFWLAPLIFDCFLCLRYNRPAERMGLVQPYQQIARSKAKIPYTPEKDTHIMKSNVKSSGRMNSRLYPYRKKSCLTARYYRLEPSLKRSRKRRIRSRA